MKTSNKILTGLLIVLIVSIIVVDFSLKSAYGKINLNDPFKNYLHVAIKPFKYLKIKGGNAYAVSITQADSLNMKVMTSRKSFLTTTNSGDTLIVRFVIATQPNVMPVNLPVGIIISSPTIVNIDANGTSNLINNWHGDELWLSQTGGASSNISGLNAGKLVVTDNQNSVVSFEQANQVKNLTLNLKNNALAYMKGIVYNNFSPLMQNEAQLVFNAASANKLKK